MVMEKLVGLFLLTFIVSTIILTCLVLKDLNDGRIGCAVGQIVNPQNNSTCK